LQDGSSILASFWQRINGISTKFVQRYVTAESNEHKAIHELQASLQAYSKVLQLNVCDMYPKVVNHFLITSVVKKLNMHLLEKISGDYLKELLMGDHDVMLNREALRQSLQRFEHARDKLRNLSS
jgi:hypothetical protein